MNWPGDVVPFFDRNRDSILSSKSMNHRKTCKHPAACRYYGQPLQGWKCADILRTGSGSFANRQGDVVRPARECSTGGRSSPGILNIPVFPEEDPLVASGWAWRCRKYHICSGRYFVPFQIHGSPSMHAAKCKEKL